VLTEESTTVSDSYLTSEREKEIDDASSIDVEINDEYAADAFEAIEEPVLEDPFNPAEINILPKQDTLRNVLERLRNGEIDMNTEFQRHAELWDTRKMSRLIESILIRFPLPAFYFDASDDDKWLVVDGLQRLSSLRKFITEIDANQRLRLRGLEYLREFNGKTYEDLHRSYQRRIDECPITLFLIQKGTPEQVKYSIFRRINTGGLVLNDQEIRNAMAKPELRAYLADLAEDEYLKKTVGDQSKRMVDQELVLRFLAFYSMDYEHGTKNITTFLDEMVKNMEAASRESRILWAEMFRRSIKRCWELFEDSAFEKRTDHVEARHKRKNSTLFEVWTVAVAGLTDGQMEKLKSNRLSLQAKHIEMMSADNDYFRSITFATQKREHFRIRRDKVQLLIREALDA
jgi:hypothetical protein